MKPKAILKKRHSLPSISSALSWANLPALEAEILLAEAVNKSRIDLFTHPEVKLSQLDWERFQNFVSRRRQAEPIAYITGYKEFYGLIIKTDRRALIPRPETEELVMWALKKNPASVADIGTGSGAVALALAKHLPDAKIYATDASPQALSLARENAQLLDLTNRIIFLKGSLLNPLPEPVELITANLPYVRRWTIAELPREIKDFEPLIALDGGDDGLTWYRKLFREAPKKLLTGGEILYELDGRIRSFTPH